MCASSSQFYVDLNLPSVVQVYDELFPNLSTYYLFHDFNKPGRYVTSLGCEGAS